MLLGFRWEDLGMCLKRHISMETNLNECSAQPRDVSPTAAPWKVQNLLPREDSELLLTSSMVVDASLKIQTPVR